MTDTTARTHAVRYVLVPGLTAALAATVVNVAIYGVAKGAGLDPLEKSGDGTAPIPLMAPLAATLVVTMALAAVVTWLIVRARPATRRPLAIAGLVVAVVSCFAPMTRTVDLADGLALSLMHLVAGSLWFAALTRR